MGRYWALRAAEIVFRIAGVVSIIGSLLIFMSDLPNRSALREQFGILVPQQTLNTLYTITQATWWLISVLYALTLYGIGQACTLLIDMRRDGEIVAQAISSRMRKSSPAAPADDSVKFGWKRDEPSKRDTLNYSRRNRPPAPEVPQDDPRRPRVYTKPEIVHEMPESRQPRPVKRRGQIIGNDDE